MMTQQASRCVHLAYMVILQLAFPLHLLQVPGATATAFTLNVDVPPEAVTEVVRLFRDAASIAAPAIFGGFDKDKTCGQNVRHPLGSAGPPGPPCFDVCSHEYIAICVMPHDYLLQVQSPYPRSCDVCSDPFSTVYCLPCLYLGVEERTLLLSSSTSDHSRVDGNTFARK